jgi:hypothetical protein
MKRLSKSIKPLLPHPAIRRDPSVKVLERFRAERVEALLTVWPHLNETRFVQNPKVPRNARLVDLNVADDVVHRQLTIPKDFDDPETRRVGERLERANMHKDIYTHWSIFTSIGRQVCEPRSHVAVHYCQRGQIR